VPHRQNGDVLCSPSCGGVAVNCNLNHSPQVNHTIYTTNGAGSAKQSEDKTVIESMSCPKHTFLAEGVLEVRHIVESKVVLIGGG
jgi:hypothetical protein